MLLNHCCRIFSRQTTCSKILYSALRRSQYVKFAIKATCLRRNYTDEKHFANIYKLSRQTNIEPLNQSVLEPNVSSNESRLETPNKAATVSVIGVSYNENHIETSDKTDSVSEISVSSNENHLESTIILQKQCDTNISKDIAESASTPALSTADNVDLLNTIAPALSQTFNLAAYVEKSELLQQLVNLGVDLSRIERHGPELSTKILKLDFEKNVKPRIQFLHSCGIAATDLGLFITRNPFIFDQDLTDMKVRINYLKSKAFTDEAITRILNKSPSFINIHTKAIDTRLGYFQKEFNLSGDEVRLLITKNSKVVITKFFHLQKCSLMIREEMGFSKEEAKRLLLSKPKIWLMNYNMFKERFDYLHNTIGFSHQTLVENPNIFTFRKFVVQQRHSYLVLLERNQYDPTKPNFVSPDTLVSKSDQEFCTNVAKTSITDYNEFLKTM